MTAGLKIERSLSGSLSLRHQNVWIGGDWGTLTLGQQSRPFESAANWDGTWFLGGQERCNLGSRGDGIRYDSNIDGPFSFAIMAEGDIDRKIAGKCGSTEVTETSTDEEIVDVWGGAAHYDFGPLTLNVSFETIQIDNAGRDSTAISLNGSVAGLDWVVAYAQSDDNDEASTQNDIDTLGIFLKYGINDNDSIYIQYESSDADTAIAAADADSPGKGTDPNATVIGYSHSFGGSTTFIAEYLTQDLASTANDSPSAVALALKVDF